jgi:hypothetical protein
MRRDKCHDEELGGDGVRGKKGVANLHNQINRPTLRAGGFMESNGHHEGDAIRAHTPDEIQKHIDATFEERIRFYAMQPPEAISRRLEELSQECDIDHVLMKNASGIALAGVLMSFLGGGRKWLLVSGTALGFLFMHGLQGWCPPAAALRRMGLRSRAEIDAERYALKLLRGDFESVHAEETHGKHYPAETVWSAVRA